MCGISGYILRGNAVRAANIIRMNDAIRHRGPDDEGYVCLQDGILKAYSGGDSEDAVKERYLRLNEDLWSGLCLGFRRLSIIDLSEKGHQPMMGDKVCITFNGEIYNFRSIRDSLIEKGSAFHTGSDTEVVLRAYQQWGIDFVQRLNGMFAIAIVDLHIGKTFLLRDRSGMKPLFYHRSGSDITWCSEMKGILKAEWVKAEMDLDGLILNYQFKTSVPPGTCFRNIYSLPPASVLSIDIATLEVKEWRYWTIPIDGPKVRISEEEAVHNVSKKLRSIMALQLQADVPLISMMSGGVDSTLITALAHEYDPAISCYTLSIDGSGAGADELPQAKRMADRLGIRQYVQHISEQDIVDNAMQQLGHFEEPYNSLDVIFDASRFLRQNGFKVILSGNGADEVFGGYGHNLNLPKWRKLRPYGFIAPLLPDADARLSRLKYYLSLRSIGQYFLSTTGGLRAHDIGKLVKGVDKEYIQKITRPFIARQDFPSDYEGLFYYDLKYSVGAHHVYHDDICAMRYSVEMRYPYLDHELIEMVAALPSGMRFDGRVNKPLLRKVAADHIEPANLQMNKKGFNLPQDAVLERNRDLQHFVAEQIAFLKTARIFDTRSIDRIVAEARGKKYYHYLWQLVSTAVWMRTYL